MTVEEMSKVFGEIEATAQVTLDWCEGELVEVAIAVPGWDLVRISGNDWVERCAEAVIRNRLEKVNYAERSAKALSECKQAALNALNKLCK